MGIRAGPVLVVYLSGVISYFIWLLTLEHDTLMPWPFIFVYSSVMLRFLLVWVAPHAPESECSYVNCWSISQSLLETCDVRGANVLAYLLLSKAIGQALLTFIYAWVYLAVVVQKDSHEFLVSIFLFTFESFCLGELFKAGPLPRPVLYGRGAGAIDFGVFKYVVAIAVCTTQNVFGFWTTSTCSTRRIRGALNFDADVGLVSDSLVANSLYLQNGSCVASPVPMKTEQHDS